MIGDNLSTEWMLLRSMLGFISEIATSVWLAWVHNHWHCYHGGGRDVDRDFRYMYYKLKCFFVIIIFAGEFNLRGDLVCYQVEVLAGDRQDMHRLVMVVVIFVE